MSRFIYDLTAANRAFPGAAREGKLIHTRIFEFRGGVTEDAAFLASVSRILFTDLIATRKTCTYNAAECPSAY